MTARQLMAFADFSVVVLNSMNIEIERAEVDAQLG